MSTKKTTRKIQTGWVISDKMEKTIVVRVMHQLKHPRYKKIIKRYNKFKVHDEGNKAKIGNFVKIEETRPLSKEKCWRLLEILKQTA
ncbi:MAG: 30S ribosomal protein S17 [Candidatus Omnitrophota bacterium]